MLQAHDFLEYVQFSFSKSKDEAKEQALTNAESEEWKKDKKNNAQMLKLIKQGVDQEVFQKIMIMSLANEAWDTLATSYKGMAKINIVKFHNTRRDFESLQVNQTEDIDSFMNRVTTVVNQLKIYGGEIKDQIVVEKVLISLSTKFDVVVVDIKESHVFVIIKN